MRKLLLALVAAGGIAAAYSRLRADRAEADLWAEATREPVRPQRPAAGT
jgi:hypothetical protein